MPQEWFHFVDKEKQVRIKIDGKVNQMITDAADLKAWTIAEVHFNYGKLNDYCITELSDMQLLLGQLQMCPPMTYQCSACYVAHCAADH